MAKAKTWQKIQMRPTTAVMDVRSRPADLPDGLVRWRLNFATTDENKMCSRDGHARAFNNTDISPYTNFDLHHQGADREKITLIYESTDNAGGRRLFAGTQSRVSKLNEATGLWTSVASGKGADGSRFKAAELQDWILFTNNVDKVFSYQISTGTVADVAELTNAPYRLPDGTSATGKSITKAKVIIQYQGVIFLMNVVQDGVRQASRVTWCDLNAPLSWVLAAPGTIAGFQDLQYGDEILAATEMNGALMIYTSKGIYKVTVSTDPDVAFGFKRIYSEPRNRSGCLAFPNTLVSTGYSNYYMSKDGIYHFNPYLSAPERVDWIHRADGVIYTKPDTKISAIDCESPVAEYRPANRELMFSWASTGAIDNNNWTLFLNTDKQTADVMDHGYTALASFGPDTDTNGECNLNQLLLGASGLDWCLKQIGGGFFSRQMLPAGSLITDDFDLDSNDSYVLVGYYRTLRGLIPAGVIDREKLLNGILIDNDSVVQAEPCVFRMRVGTSYNVVDPNSVEDRCSPLWRRLADITTACIDESGNIAMRSKNQRPAQPKDFNCYEQGRFLYFELTIANKDGSPALGGDVCISRLEFTMMALAP